MTRRRSDPPPLSGSALASTRRKNGRKGGRPPGALNKSTVEKLVRAEKGIKAALDTGVMPLDVLLHRMRGTMDVTDAQVDAAVAAAPYCHAKYTAIAYRDMTPKEGEIDLSQCTAEQLAILRKVVGRGPATAPGRLSAKVAESKEEELGMVMIDARNMETL